VLSLATPLVRPLAAQLAVRTADGDVAWWSAAAAPTRWAGPLPLVAGAVRWEAVRPGLEQGRLDLTGGGPGGRITVVLARLDPARFLLRLDTLTRDGLAGWTIDAAPEDAALAVNAGQFAGGVPWGWLVLRGRELQAPGIGPLSSALVIDGEGRVSLLDADSIAAARASGRALEAFQSYPAVLVDDGVVPAPLRAPGGGVSLTHRDTRVGLCLLRDGRLLVALTRFALLGDAFSRLPYGPTTPEMAALLGALGCRRAVLLDGGLSGQLALRDEAGRLQRWPGLRRVPLALGALPRR
jgi:hypothetical protein